MSKEENVIKYYVTCNKLKDVIRSGWKDWNVKRERVESVAEHVFGVQMIAIAMKSEFNYDIDTKEAESTIPSSEKAYGIIKDAPVKFMSQAAVTVAKTIPTYAAKRVKFNTDLNSGEDVSFYASLYTKFDFEFYFINKEEEANYYRIQRNVSVSKQEMTYQFNVLDRLKVMDDLDENYRIAENKKTRKYIEMCFQGQTGFIQRYLQKHPEDEDKVLKEVEKHDFKYFPYFVLEM